MVLILEEWHVKFIQQVGEVMKIRAYAKINFTVIEKSGLVKHTTVKSAKGIKP